MISSFFRHKTAFFIYFEVTNSIRWTVFEVRIEISEPKNIVTKTHLLVFDPKDKNHFLSLELYPKILYPLG